MFGVDTIEPGRTCTEERARGHMSCRRGRMSCRRCGRGSEPLRTSLNRKFESLDFVKQLPVDFAGIPAGTQY